jgi:hypothetical protein
LIALDEYGIIWMENLTHEIYTFWKCDKEANNFLWPFTLIAAGDGMKKQQPIF